MENQNNGILQIDQDTWSLEDGFVRFFLLKGSDKALLIDSGADIKGVKDLAYRALGRVMPIELLNTHGDGDHCFGNREFDWFYLHEADHELYRRQFGNTGDMVPVRDGDRMDLGNRPIEIIHIPGHTHGSIAVLDVQGRVLYPGDSVQDGDIFMFGDHRNLEEYPASLMKLLDMENRFDVVYASHGSLKMEPESIGKLFDACERIFHGEAEAEERKVHDTMVHAYDCGIATFLIDLDREFAGEDQET